MSAERLTIATTLPPSAEDISAGYIAHPVADFQTYEVFDVSGDTPAYKAAADFRQHQLDEFTAGNIRNPVLNNCPGFQEGRTERRGMALQILSLFHAQQLRRADRAERTLEDDMVDANIALKINELGFVETAALLAENTLDPADRIRMGELLRSAGREIYGLPDRNVALTLVAKRLEAVAELAETDDEQLQSIAVYIQDNFAMPEDYEPTPFEGLDEAAIRHYEKIIAEECREDIETAFAEVGEKDEYTPEDMQRIYQKYLEVRGFADSGWQAEVIEDRTMCASSLTGKTVEIGADRPAAKRDYEHVVKTMVHEIEVHVGRNVRGQKLGSGIAGKGLVNYTFFEEPFAGTVEDLYRHETSQRGEPYVVAIALSTGIDGKPRDYRDSFELLWRMSFATKYTADKPIDEQIAQAQQSARTPLVRIWRGMPTDIPGCILAKDRSYENSDVVNLLRNGGKLLPRADFLRLLAAKYDPRITEQDAYIRQFL